MDTIAVTGGTGEFGRAVTEQLLESGRSVIVTVRDPGKAADLTDRGVVVRSGDFDDPETLTASLNGVSTVLINGAFVGDLHRRRTRFTSAISAATHAGVSRIVLASFPEANTCPIPEATDYIEAEAALRAAGPDWTIVREAVSMANPIAREVAWATRFGQLRAPTAGALCVPAAITDLAEATARVLADPPGNATVYEFSGPRAVDWTELAELASELAGQTIHFEPTDDAGFETVLAEAGVPAWHAPGWRNFHAAFRAGWGSHSYPDLGAVLGRAPVDTREAIRRRIPTLAN